MNEPVTLDAFDFHLMIEALGRVVTWDERELREENLLLIKLNRIVELKEKEETDA